MHPDDWRLINGEYLEALPATLARGRGNVTARALAHNDWLIRRKTDGRFLAFRRADVVTEMGRGRLTPELREDLLALANADAAGEALRPLSGLIERLHGLGLEETGYGERSGLPMVAEPCTLAYAGRDRYARPLWLSRSTARAWRRMRETALRDGQVLDAISGYRSHDYQLGIFRRKLARGLRMEEILAVNAAPGFSEHHSGCALDISCPGQPAAEESFEVTPAFAWLDVHACSFGFKLSYPRGNRHGIVYEPWHWRWQPPGE